MIDIAAALALVLELKAAAEPRRRAEWLAAHGTGR